MQITEKHGTPPAPSMTVTSSDFRADTAHWFNEARKGVVTVVDDATGKAKLTLTIPQTPVDVDGR